AMTADAAFAATPAIQPLALLVEREQRRRRRGRLIRWTILALVLVAILAAWRTVRPRPVPLPSRFRVQAVAPGDVVREVRASGSLEALKTVQVGAQTSGRIESVHVDYNDHVTAGQILAQFDPRRFAPSSRKRRPCSKPRAGRSNRPKVIATKRAATQR